MWLTSNTFNAEVTNRKYGFKYDNPSARITSQLTNKVGAIVEHSAITREVELLDS